MGSRAVFTVAMNRPEMAEQALGLGRSLKLIGDQTPRYVLTDMPDHPWDRCFDHVIVARDKWNGLEMTRGLELTGADHVLAVDCDALAFKRLDDIFNWCEGNGVCLQGWMAKEGPWWDTTVETLREELNQPEIPRYNSGILYYERRADVEQFLADVPAVRKQLDEGGRHRNRHGVTSFEITLLFALARHPSVFTLIPDRMNFQNSGAGPVAPLELDVLENRCRFVVRQRQIAVVKPYIFHAYFYRHDPVYQLQLSKLRKLDEFEAKHPYGHFPSSRKLRRSIEKRWLQWTGKI